MSEQIGIALLDQTINGLVLGNLYALVAIGLALIFGVANVLNFAHGSVYMAGAYVGWLCITRLHLPLVVTFGLVAIFCGGLGIGIERIGLRALYGSARIAPLLATLGISLILEQTAQIVFGPFPQAFPSPLPSERIPIAGVSIGVLDLLIAGISLASGLFLYCFLRFTRLGWAVRAMAQDRDAAQQMGVDVNLVNQGTFAIASALAGIVGMLVGMYFNVVFPTMGYQAGLKGFAAALLGGLGNIPGAIAGSLILGLTESYGVAWLGASYRNLFAFIILLIVLVLFPNGLFGGRRGLPPEPLTGTFIAISRPLRLPPRLVWGLSLLALALPLFVSNGYVLQTLTNAWLYGLLALSLTLVAGTSGLMSLGHAGLLAIGGYASALLVMKLGLPFEVALPAAGLITAGLGTLLILPAFRLRGHYVAIATLGIGESVGLILLNWQSLTAGPVGLNNIPPLTLAGQLIVTPQATYWLALILLLLVALLQMRLVRSHLGRTLRAIREDEVAAQCYGISLNRYKTLVFAVSSFAAGISGAFTAHMYSYINPETFNNTISILGLTMAILGGLGNTVGAVIGAILLIILPEFFRGFVEERILIYGVLLVVLIRFRPQGLMGTI
ncbi:ABC transporter permease [Nostoc sp. NMS8]|uniref:ABC transporter permease n=1 Tax=Nostoc sp. NMS8 TaxID=2815392 RepID=UPI0025DC5A92|nr:ABC transporter permease [Nostoc sp. NMS8]MBN3962526.1 ABC transporter permease [Nostoc sp. NMS8]